MRPAFLRTAASFRPARKARPPADALSEPRARPGVRPRAGENARGWAGGMCPAARGAAAASSPALPAHGFPDAPGETREGS